MAESMVERLGLHFAERQYGRSDTRLSNYGEAERFREEARAVIDAMREPTEAMVEAGALNRGNAPKAIYDAMLDAALTEETSDE